MASLDYRAEDYPGVQRLPAPTPDNFSYVVPIDYTLHTPDKPFCDDLMCGCHEDELLIAEVNSFVEAGLLTPEEATDFINGRTI